ncbi:SMU1112c/YaeR family gloxylase I-like metalloprotein [Chitinimonas lacunae]|uniref:VOC family protein n=1 Tax=Chitinimonas lacunae TaxID=1963018 RepID=A0ABV8MTK9_9NEIS
MITAFHHVALIVSDLATARRFYCEVLGLAELAAHYRAERASWKVDLVLPGGGQLELFTFPEAPVRLSRPEALGLRHLALTVADLDAALQRLAHYAVSCEPVRVDPHTGARFTFCTDPDGLPIELVERR